MADRARRRCRSRGALAACMAATRAVWECYVQTVCPQLNPWLIRAYRVVSRLCPVVAGMQCRLGNHGRQLASFPGSCTGKQSARALHSPLPLAHSPLSLPRSLASRALLDAAPMDAAAELAAAVEPPPRSLFYPGHWLHHLSLLAAYPAHPSLASPCCRSAWPPVPWPPGPGGTAAGPVPGHWPAEAGEGHPA